MTTVFVVAAVIGVGLLLVGLVFDDVIDGVLDAVPGDLDGGGILSAQVIGAFLGAFGIGGLVTSSLAGGSAVAGVAGGLGAGLALGFLALRLTIAFVDMPTDDTPKASDFTGQLGRIVTPVLGGRGEAMLRIGGAPVKVTALASEDIEHGIEVVVVEVVSSSTVRVVPFHPEIERRPV